ncbi:MAG: hypothetical protein ACPIOQ_07090 [Promethearchaeia archaeon]
MRQVQPISRSLWRRKLDLEENGIDEDGVAILRACWPGDSGLEIGVQYDMVDDEEDMDFPGGYGFFYLDDEFFSQLFG